MFRITREPSSGSFIHCLAKNYSKCSIVSVDMDVVGVMAAYLSVVHVCTAQSRETLCVYCAVHTQCLSRLRSTHSASLDCTVHKRTTDKYAAIAPTTFISTDTIEPLL